MEPSTSYPSTSKKRFTGFSDKWTKYDPEFSDWIKKKDEFTAICKTCNSEIAIQYEGRRALTLEIKRDFQGNS
ncbi:unnamed protein product [Euphydryas editha]|uniref:Uncharacterized protein n=1 Tax=Euphydryas editha TaxID=104508 RepID=A0AAU9TL68_EUPED|nr:unnamed protein product [Euphydryas editha]